MSLDPPLPHAEEVLFDAHLENQSVFILDLHLGRTVG